MIKLSNKDIFTMNGGKLDEMMDSVSRVPESKVFSKHEDLSIKASILSFGKTVTQCSKGHMVPVEFKGIVKQFEEANYDVAKLPYVTMKSFKKTYDDLKTVCANHNEFKNTQAKLYCDIYEFFSNAANLKFLSRLRKDPIMKEVSSKESLDMESIEAWLNEYDAEDEKSQEAFGAIGATIASIKASFLTLSTTLNSTMLSIQALTTLISVLMIIIGVLLVILIVINLNYKSELSNILAILAENDINDKTSNEDCNYKAAKNMCENTNAMVKNFVFKPAKTCLNGVSTITSKAYNWFDKVLTAAKNKKLAKESLDPEQSEEFLIGGLISIPVFIVLILVLIMSLIQPAVYFFYHLRLKGYEFLSDECEMIEANMADLRREMANATSEQEKARIAKIIEKQKGICERMAAFANILYKSEVDAAMDTRDDTRKDDNTDYRQIAEDMGNATTSDGDSTDTGAYNPETDPTQVTETSDSGSNKPVVIF